MNIGLKTKSILKKQVFNCVQTPTDISYKIFESDEPKLEYVKYVKSLMNEDFIQDHLEKLESFFKENKKIEWFVF